MAAVDHESWPERSAICLSCRTAVPDGGSCDCTSKALVPFRQSEGVEHLMTSVWGPVLQPGQIPTAAKVAVVVLAPLAVASLLVELPLIAAVGVSLGLSGIAAAILRSRSRRAGKITLRQRFLPAGASDEARRLTSGSPVTGTVVARQQLPAPITGRPCVAFALELSRVDAEGLKILLRDAATVSFEIASDGGETIRIPGGRVEILGGKPRKVSSEQRVGRYLDSFGIAIREGEVNQPFPYDRALESVLVDGARVRLHNAVQVRPDPAAQMRSYREGAAAIHEVVDEVPRVEILAS